MSLVEMKIYMSWCVW